MQLARRGVDVHPPGPAARRVVAGRSRAGVLERHGAHRRHDSRVLAEGRRALPGVRFDDGAPWRVSVGADGNHAAVVERGGNRGALGPAEAGAALPRSRTEGRLSSAAVGSDGGRRSRRRVVRDRPAPGRHCGARDFRHGAGTVVRGDRHRPPPQRGDRSGPRRQQRHDQGRPGCADGRDGAGGARRGGGDPHRRRGRACQYPRRTRHGRDPRRRHGDPRIRGGLECGSPPHLPEPRGPDRAGSRIPDKDPPLPVSRARPQK